MADKNPWQAAEKHLAAADKALKPYIEKYGPCRLAPQTDHFTVLCESIVSQQLAVKAADAIYARFAALYGGRPEPGPVAATPLETLRSIGLSLGKATYIHDLAAKTADGLLTPGAFPSMSDEEITAQLLAVKGIGVWTTHMFLIFALNRPDVLPVGDFGVRKAIMRTYDLAAMPGKDEMEKIAGPWRPWRSVASWYLWRSLENT